MWIYFQENNRSNRLPKNMKIESYSMAVKDWYMVYMIWVLPVPLN